MLLVFGASFLGGFEIKLPSSWTNKVDEKAGNTTGMLSIFLMAFTLALVSFSCTGPIIGFLLVEAATSGDIFAPAVGMFGFALSLALPFTLFAIFPSLLKQTPRSGSWMNTIKVVLGFVEIAFALKFLSVADLTKGWGILDRETFLALWIGLFILLGMYLLKIIRMPHDDPSDKTTSVTGFFGALLSFAFAIYMIPGLWGAPCKAISAFAPPMFTQDFSMYDNTFKSDTHDYDEALRMSREQNKPIFLDFTGHGCVNCREMETAVLGEAAVLDILRENYIVASLYVDDRALLDKPFVGKDGLEYSEVGEKWSYLQQHKFGELSQPFYVLVDADGQPLSGSFAFKKDVGDFVDFLNEGLKNFKK
jgi:thiol:disulfide interchange protein DsbD